MFGSGDGGFGGGSRGYGISFGSGMSTADLNVSHLSLTYSLWGYVFMSSHSPLDRLRRQHSHLSSEAHGSVPCQADKISRYQISQ